jgi:hypothetical protein
VFFSSSGVQAEDGQGQVLASSGHRVAVFHRRLRRIRLQKWSEHQNDKFVIFLCVGAFWHIYHFQGTSAMVY